jgi:hypothetical protein
MESTDYGNGSYEKASNAYKDAISSSGRLGTTTKVLNMDGS